MATVARHAGRVNEKGELVLVDPSAWRAAVVRHKGRDVWVTVVRQQQHHSLPQRRYYHGVVCVLIGEYIGENPDDVHEYLKLEILGKRNVETLDGKILEMPPTTKGFTTEQMSDYTERCKRWAASFLGLYIPDPDQVEVSL